MDTSALVQFYVEQGGTVKVQEIMSEADEIIISPVTKLESLRTFRRLLEDKVIENQDYTRIKELFINHAKDFTVLSLDPSLELIAENLIEKYALKTLDSIQLASAVSVKDKLTIFVSTDKRLIKTVKLEDIETLIPGE